MHKQTRYQKEMTANTELIRINEVNISQLAELIPAELRSNLGREYFRGLGIRDETMAEFGVRIKETCRGS